MASQGTITQGCEQSASWSSPSSLERGLCTAICPRDCRCKPAIEIDQCTSVCILSFRRTEYLLCSEFSSECRESMSIREYEQDCRPTKRVCLGDADKTCVRSSNSFQDVILYESEGRSGYSPGFQTPTDSQSTPTPSEAGGLNSLTWHHDTHQHLTTNSHSRPSITNTQYTANGTREPVTTANLPLFDGTVGESRPHISLLYDSLEDSAASNRRRFCAWKP